MVQKPLIAPEHFRQLSRVSVEEVSAYRRWRAESGVAEATLAAEVSQLRSLARQAEQRSGSTLSDLRGKPQEATQLIEQAGQSLSLSTILTRIRAFERFLMMGASPYLGRQRVEAFRAALPKKASRGWHEAGVSPAGTRTRKRMPGPTPTLEALEAIVEAGLSRSLRSGAVAALACFSGLDVKEMRELRWRDLHWHDNGASPYWEVKVRRRGHRATVFVVGLGAKALLKHGLSSGLDRDASVLRGRESGEPLSERALRDDLKHTCASAGWPRATRPQLLSAFAAWLRSCGFDDHSIRLTVGRRRAATVDRLLHRQTQLEAQEAIDAANLA
jgi:integrase